MITIIRKGKTAYTVKKFILAINRISNLLTRFHNTSILNSSLSTIWNFYNNLVKSNLQKISIMNTILKKSPKFIHQLKSQWQRRMAKALIPDQLKSRTKSKSSHHNNYHNNRSPQVWTQHKIKFTAQLKHQKR